MSVNTEEFLLNQPRTRLCPAHQEFCEDLKYKLADSAYVVIVNSEGLVTFTALKRGLFRSPMDEILWNGIMQERMIVQRLETTSEGVGMGPNILKVRDLGWNTIQHCALANFDHLSDVPGIGIAGWSLVPSESMVRRVIAEDSEPWFTWPPFEVSPLEARWMDFDPFWESNGQEYAARERVPYQAGTPNS